MRFARILLVSLPLWAQEGGALRIQVVEGEGIIYPVGARSARGITVKVTDLNQKPVDGATVSFLLPERGPGGIFPSGSRTEIDTTGADGRAEAWGMRWNREPGPVDIRVVAAKGNFRASLVAHVTLTSALEAKSSSGGGRVSSGGHKWLWITLAAAGAAGAGLATTGFAAKSAAAAAAAITPPAPVIGLPTITIDRP